jgi:hypothetical protein
MSGSDVNDVVCSTMNGGHAGDDEKVLASDAAKISQEGALCGSTNIEHGGGMGTGGVDATGSMEAGTWWDVG